MNTYFLHTRFFASVLIIAFFAQSFSKGLIIANYYTNTQLYAQNCINKAKPKMHCNGKCQMIKKLKQEENKDHQNPERKNEVKTDLLYFSQTNMHINNLLHLQKLRFPLLQYKLTKDFAGDFFHPPNAA